MNETRPATIAAVEPDADITDDVDAKSWTAIERLAGQVLRSPATFLRRLRAAMDHADDAGIAVIAHELRTNPSLCGELIGGEQMGRPDRARAQGLEVAKALRAAVIALRRRRNDRDAASYRRYAGQAPEIAPFVNSPIALANQDSGLETNVMATADGSTGSVDEVVVLLTNTVSEVCAIAVERVTADTTMHSRFGALRRRLESETATFGGDSAGVLMSAD